MKNNPFSLSHKTIFVTGASSGIGRAVAIECSKVGAQLVITGRDKQRLDETYNNLEGGNHIQFLADLSNTDFISSMVDTFPILDGIVHCAGFTQTVAFKYINEKDFDNILKVNLVAPALISRAILKKGKLNKNSSIVFISSISGVYCSSVGAGMYSASKGAINGFVKNLALELSNKAIRVNSVCPGMINTNIYDSGTITKEQLTDDMKRYPLGRYGQPEEVAYGVIYLLSDASCWVTGSNLLIDGGYTLL